MISSSLPRFRAGGYVDKDGDDDYRGARAMSGTGPGRGIRTFMGSMFRRKRLRLVLGLLLVLVGYLFFGDGVWFSGCPFRICGWNLTLCQVLRKLIVDPRWAEVASLCWFWGPTSREA